jgi:DNA-binding winged helix-turn-helix (wHTH) protein
MKDVKNHFYRLNNIEIDVQNLRVTVDSEIRPLEPKSFRLLLFLVQNSGRVLPKDEIMAAVWPDAFVSDNSLNRAVTQIRKRWTMTPKHRRTSRRYLPSAIVFLRILTGSRTLSP